VFVSGLGIWLMRRGIVRDTRFIGGLLKVPVWLLILIGILLQVPLIWYIFLGFRAGLNQRLAL
jgi:hypothetical protein